MLTSRWRCGTKGRDRQGLLRQGEGKINSNSLGSGGLGVSPGSGVQEELNTNLELYFQSTPPRPFPLQSPGTTVTVDESLELNRGSSHLCPPVCPGPFPPASPQASPH